MQRLEANLHCYLFFVFLLFVFVFVFFKKHPPWDCLVVLWFLRPKTGYLVSRESAQQAILATQGPGIPLS